jgi:CelD/BcsL family acetyltransferase involved in cellulose biosynthesis
LIGSFEAVEQLRPQWDELYGRCERATPFQSPAWLLPWARHFAPDRLCAVAVRERGHGELVAFLPFFTWRNRVLLAGCGPTDYCDGLFSSSAAGTADEALATLVDYAEHVGCECVDLQQLASQSPLLAARTPERWRSEVCDGAACPVTRLGDGDALEAISPKWRKNVVKARRKLRSVTAFTLECASQELFNGAADELMRLHAARWNRRDEGGVFADPLMRGFLASALPELSAAGLLRLHTLHADARLIAILLGVHHGPMTCFYIGGFDPQWSAYSPGTITLESAMVQAARDGAVEFHFLRGCEGYKYHFGAQDRPTFNRMLVRAGSQLLREQVLVDGIALVGDDGTLGAAEPIPEALVEAARLGVVHLHTDFHASGSLRLGHALNRADQPGSDPGAL